VSDRTAASAGEPPPTSHGARRRLLEAGEGSSADAFQVQDWGSLATIALVWGSSFLLIELGLRSFAPGVVTLLRVGLGLGTLALFPQARRADVTREDLLRISLLGWIWIGVPFLLFPIAQQHVTSSVAGMINGAMPVTAAVWATVLLRRMPGRVQLLGILVGFGGIVLVFLPQLQGSSATVFGTVLLLVASSMYGLSTQLVVPLQQRYGSLPVILRAQLSALVIITPVGLWQLGSSSFSWESALAMLPLGVLGTGIALVVMAGLAGRVGGARASVAIYLVPIVSIVLGVTLLDETVAPLALVGMALVLLGAWLTSRAEAR
jgi:drug/metabolite transporter (DMT)-like permease